MSDPKRLRELADAVDAAYDNVEVLERFTSGAASDALRAYADLLERTRWVPVEERLPEEDVVVVVACHGEILTGKYVGLDHPYAKGKPAWEDSGEGLLLASWSGRETYSIVTHWMPLPDPPT